MALTAHAMKGDAEKCLAAGMDGYLAKPLQLRELTDAVARVVPGAGRPRTGPAASVDSLPSSTRLDTARLLERVGGDRRALARIVRTSARTSRSSWRSCAARWRPDDAGALRRAAHALKGAVSNFAATPATEAAMELQTMGDRQDLGAAPGALVRLELELESLSAELLALVGGRAASGSGRPKRAAHPARRKPAPRKKVPPKAAAHRRRPAVSRGT